MAEDRFLNPYNFIRFPKEKARAYTDTDKHTGVIEYTITTKTPLIIPNSSSESAFKESLEVKDHRSYDFFSYTELENGKTYENEYHIPVIPGSEIRGVIRSVYETLTDSCMGILNEDIHPVKRSGENFLPGLLYRGKDKKVILYKAESYRVYTRITEKYKNGKKLYFTPERVKNIYWKIIDSVSETQAGHKEAGYLLKWGMGAAKKNYHIFKPAKEKIREFSGDEAERELVSVIDSYLNQPGEESEESQKYRDACLEYKKNLSEFIKKEDAYFPVNYSVLNDRLIYLSPATYTKEVYHNSIGKLAGQFVPCKENFCPACELFGHMGKDNETSKSSGIRFTDLYVADEKDAKEYYLCNKVTLQVLGGPKPANVDFYLKKPKNADFWTYDYFVMNKEIHTDVESMALRGRKYYWHHPAFRLNEVRSKPQNLNETARPVKEGVRFKGKLYFESVSEKQLKQLLWILNSGTEQLGYKMGKAKPLGFGSISCTVDAVLERKVNLTEDGLQYVENKYSVDELPCGKITYETAEFSESVKKEFETIAGFNTLPKDTRITYPRTPEQKNGEMEEGFRWFQNNRSKASRKEVKIFRTLPVITSKNVGLPYDPQGKVDSSNRNNIQNQNPR